MQKAQRPRQQTVFGEPPNLESFCLVKFEEENDKKGYHLVAEKGGISKICKKLGCLFSRLGAFGKFNQICIFKSCLWSEPTLLI